jgi:hypothetical protein
MAALKEYKYLTKNDAISSFEGTTENILALVYVGIKGGYRFLNEKKEIKQDELAGKLMPRELKDIIKVFQEQCGLSQESPGEIVPS